MLGKMLKLGAAPMEERAKLFQQGVVQTFPGIPVHMISGVKRTREVLDINHEAVHRFRAHFGDQLRDLTRTMKRVGAETVVLEGGHVYVKDEVGESHRRDVQLTAMMEAYLRNEGFKVNSLLFVDDYHATDEQRDSFTLDDYLSFTHRYGWDPMYVAFEKEMQPVAAMLHNKLEGGDSIVRTDGEQYLKGASRVALTTDTCEWSCALLDAGLTVSKFALMGADATVTVMPRSYKGEQRNMRRIVRAATEQIGGPMFNFFYNPEGAVSTGSFHGYR